MTSLTVSQARLQYAQELARHTFSQFSQAQSAAQQREKDKREGKISPNQNGVTERSTNEPRRSSPSTPGLRVVDFGGRGFASSQDREKVAV